MSPDAEKLALLVHEVRSPVAAIAAIHEALKVTSEPESGGRRRLVELAVDACEAIERLVRGTTVTSVSLEQADVARLVEDVAAAASLTSSTRIVARCTGEPLVARADPARLRQALDNLVRNAAAVSPAEAEVVIEARTTDAAVTISVSDSGPGIAGGDLERIFEPGVRLDGTRPGSGLGLAVARAIAEGHGGTLSVESSVGAGATFTLSLPRR